jgi:hypothetical protein
MTGQETRNKLTDFWRGHDIKEGQVFAILTKPRWRSFRRDRLPSTRMAPPAQMAVKPPRKS